MTTIKRLHLNDVITSELAQLLMLEVLRLIVKPRRSVYDSFGAAHCGRCD